MSKLETCWRRPSGRAERGSRGFILHVDRELLDLLNNFDAEICKVWSHSRPDAKPLLETGLHLCVSMVRVWHRPGSKPMFAWVLQVREVELVVVARARAEQGRSSLPQIRGNVKCRATSLSSLAEAGGVAANMAMMKIKRAAPACQPLASVLRQLLGPVSWQMMPLFFH